MIRMVNFCGGRGSKYITMELLNRGGVFLTNIVNAYDDGKSTGEIRKVFKMLGPSDIRKTQTVMMSNGTPNDARLKEIFEYRLPAGIENEEAKEELGRVSHDGSKEVFGLILPEGQPAALLRKFFEAFLQSLNLYEKVHGMTLNFSDCSLANCIYAGAFELCSRDFDRTVDVIGRLLNIRGEVLTTNVENKVLTAIRENGEILFSEAEIVELRSNVRIKDLFILDNYLDKTASSVLESFNFGKKLEYLQKIQSYVVATSRVKERITNADIILYSPGTQHSSLYPSYMTRGIPEAIRNNNKALKVFVANIGEDYETPAYTASELIVGAIRYLNKFQSEISRISNYIDLALVNSEYQYQEQKYVKADEDELRKLDIDIVLDSLEDIKNPGKHDAVKVVNRIMEEYNKRWVHHF
ncbi:YvcK family protein [bacterium]|nr:YvcK family protein [bacterium]